eukprot:gene13733-17540_t
MVLSRASGSDSCSRSREHGRVNRKSRDTLDELSSLVGQEQDQLDRMSALE